MASQAGRLLAVFSLVVLQYGKATEGIASPGDYCSSGACARWLICEDNQCKIKAGSSCDSFGQWCVSGTVCAGVCRADVGQACSIHSHCRHYALCESGICRFDVGQACTTDSDCRHGAVCGGGTPHVCTWLPTTVVEPSSSWGPTEIYTAATNQQTTYPGVSGYLCPNAWTVYEDTCYLFVDHAYSWAQAQYMCISLGAYLAEPRSEAENNFVAHMYHLHGAAFGWIGLGDTVVENEWVWSSDQSSSTYTHWAPGEPNNQDDQDCVEIYSDSGLWNDKHCSGSDHQHQGFICEKQGTPVIIG